MLIKLECPKCGEEMTMKTEKGFSFCNNCGERVSFGTAQNRFEPQVNNNAMPTQQHGGEIHPEYRQQFNQQPHQQPYNQYVYPQQTDNHSAQNQYAYSVMPNASAYESRRITDYYLKTSNYLSSLPVLVMAIAQSTMVAVLLMIGIHYDVFWGMLFLSIPAVAAGVESWVTYGTGKWGKTGVNTAGMTVGKVFGVIHIAITGIIVFSELICAIIWSTVSSWIGDELKDILEFIFGTDFGVKNIQSLSINLGMIIFLATLAPLAFWIVLQIMLNKFRDNVRFALNKTLTSDIKVMFPVVLLFLYALPCFALGIVLLKNSEYLWSMSVLLQGGLFAFGGILMIILEKTLNEK